MRRDLALVACLALMTYLSFEARAGSIPADVSMTVGPSILDSIPSTYTLLIPDVNTMPSFSVGGAEPSLPPLFDRPENFNIQTTFNMTITFEGPSGSHPSVDVTGNVTGDVDMTAIPSSSPFYAMGYNLTGSMYGSGTGTSATLQGWTPASGIPMSTIEPYLDPSIYNFGIRGASGWASLMIQFTRISGCSSIRSRRRSPNPQLC